MASEEFRLDDPVGSYVDTWKRICLEPRSFFGELSREGGIGLAVFGGGLKGLLALVLVGLVRLFVGAALLTLVARQLFEGQGDYEASFRVLAYSTAVVVFVGIPVLKVLAALYGAYLAILGVERVHGIDPARATLSVAGSIVAGFALVYALGLWPTVARWNPLAH
jgi:hypothetical protein